QPHDEAGAAPFAFALRFHGSAMQLDQTAHERETNSQAVLEASVSVVGLRKAVEHAGQHILGDADARIRDTHHHIVIRALRLDVDAPSRVRVFGGVVKQVGENLSKTDAIGVEQHRLIGEDDAKLQPGLVNQLAVHLQGVANDGSEEHPFLEQLDDAVAEARNIEQIVDNAHKMLGLALHYRDNAVGALFGLCP